ncbi:Putative lipoprotein mlpA precursor [Archangium gephyra]|nr:Putative lipoprotein mlpA precursor [Archangium gephyra]
MVPLGCAAWLGACGAEQPAPQCTVGRGDHAVRYTLKTGTGACALKTAEIVGAQVFREPGSGIPPSLVLKPKPLADNEGKDANPSHSVTSLGNFTTEYPTDDGVCVVPELSEARQTVSSESGTTEWSYRWSGLRIQGQAAIPGTQWTAELTYSEGDCTATYEAVGVFPAILCVRQETGADGKPVNVRDPRVCKQPRPGLSMDPAFPITCDESTNLCVLEGQPPVLIP